MSERGPTASHRQPPRSLDDLHLLLRESELSLRSIGLLKSPSPTGAASNGNRFGSPPPRASTSPVRARNSSPRASPSPVAGLSQRSPFQSLAVSPHGTRSPSPELFEAAAILRDPLPSSGTTVEGGIRRRRNSSGGEERAHTHVPATELRIDTQPAVGDCDTDVLATRDKLWETVQEIAEEAPEGHRKDRLTKLLTLHNQCSGREAALRQTQVAVMFERNHYLKTLRSIENYGVLRDWGQSGADEGARQLLHVVRDVLYGARAGRTGASTV